MESEQGYPAISVLDISAVTSEQMRQVDRIAVDEFGLQLLQMMENAGRALAEVALKLFHPRAATIVAGPGGNGGGGLAAARHLVNRGVRTDVCLLQPESEMSAESAAQAGILSAMGVGTLEEVGSPDLVVDAIFGYGLNRAPTGRAKSLIEQINQSDASVLSLDVPSGLDATTGDAPGAIVMADATLTLALPKRGLVGAEQAGALYLADISIPAAVYERVGIEIRSIFDRSQIVRLV